MTALTEEVVVEEKEIFFCIFLDDKGQCLSEKRQCPKDRKEKKCQEVEDNFQ